jgi:hypothetical protein
LSGHKAIGLAALNRLNERKEYRMSTTKIAVFGGVAVVVAAALIFTMRTNNSASTTDGQGIIGTRAVTTAEINPFSHTASIPATVDPATIRFEKLSEVELASKTQTESQDCKDKQFRDPDGSSCGSVKVIERVKALEATYSYVGPELSAGEATPGRQTFSVYFRPQEVGVDGPVAKLKREQAAAFFEVNTFRPVMEQKIVDKQKSKYCEGSYVDGNWVQKDASCHDQIQYVSQTAPVANWTVQVDLRHPVTIASR